MLSLLVLLSIILVYLTIHILHHTSSKKKGLPLPPGSMGWPYIGETLKLYSQNPNAFFSSRQRRYGDVFKTHILGCPCVMIANPEGAKFVLVSQAKLFKPIFPTSKQNMIGPQALFFHEGPYHAKIRKLVLSCFQSEGIRDMISIIEDITISTLHTWEGKKVNTLMEMKKFSFKVGILKIFGYQEKLDMDDLDKAYATLEKGYNSLQINIPGTKYGKAMKARKHLREVIGNVLKMKRRGTNHVTIDDHKSIKPTFIDILMDYKDHSSGDTSPSQGLTEEQIVDNIIGVIFASRDTTASVMTWLIKFLKTNPTLLDGVTAEQQSIKIRNEQHNQKLSWEDTRNMPLTNKVILETLRVATILSFTFREAVDDVEYKGYIIPKGWKVLPLFRNIHHNPEYFTEPHKFDPSRFEVPPKPNTFMPFGNGVHACPGSEFAKLEMIIFLHHLTTEFRWELDEHKNGVQYSPFRVPEEGLPIQVERK